MRSLCFLAAALALSSAACADQADDGGDGDACHGKCDDDGLKAGLLYAPQYDHDRGWANDGAWGLENANLAAARMAELGWGTIEVVSVDGIEEMLLDLDARAAAGSTYDLIGTVSHATRGGPVFNDTTDTRKTVQAGWSWYGFDQDISELENGGPVDIDGLKEMTSRVASVTAPDGRVVFLGCNTGNATDLLPRSEPVDSAYKQGTPFFIEGAEEPTRYKTYIHAFADLTGLLVQGANTRMSLGLSSEVLETLYYGGDEGTGALPRYFRSVLPVDAKADALGAIDATYVFDEAEGVYEADGGCRDDIRGCATAGERWARDF